MDVTEQTRRILQPVVNGLSDDEVAQCGQTWTTDELTRDFNVVGFAAPFVVVTRKSDGVKGSMAFRHDPRVYFDFQPYAGA